MNNDKKPGIIGLLGAILTWVGILFLLLWLVSWLLERKWGAFLVLALLGTVGSVLIIALALGMIFEMAGCASLSTDDNVIAGVWIAGGIIGVICAAVSLHNNEHQNP